MNNPKDENRQKALALAALANGIIPRTTWGLLAYHTVKMENGSPCCVDAPECDSPIEALAAAAEALGLEPDPAVQQRSHAGMVMVSVRDVEHVASFLALFRGEEPSQVYDMDHAARERLDELLTAFASLAPKRSTPDSQEGGKPDA